MKKFLKQTPQKWEFGFKIQFRNFQKPKIKLKKDPLIFQKIKNIKKEASNEKVLKNKPPKNGNYDSKYNFEIFKNQKSNSKKTP